MTDADDLRLLRDSTSRFLVDLNGGAPKREKAVDPRDAWRRMADLGWFALAVPERLGGLGGSAADLLAILEESGRALAPEPLIPALMAVPAALSRLSDEPLVGAFMQGSAAFAYVTDDPRRSGLRVARGLGGIALSGRSGVSPGADRADHFIVAVSDDDRTTVVHVPAAAEDPLRLATRLLDGTKAARVRFSGSWLPGAGVIASGQEGLALAEEMEDRAAAGAVARGFGAAEAGFRLTLDYLKHRKQFGRPLASFQALQHAMVDAFCSLEQMRSLLGRLTTALDGPAVVRARAVSTAKVFLHRRVKAVLETCIQLSGGIGVTEEYALGHHYKTVLTQAALFGDARFHLERLASAARRSREVRATQ